MLLDFLKHLFGKRPLPFPAEYFVSDRQFNQLYPPSIRKAALKHFTQLDIAKQAAEFLVNEDNVKILDIGSGAGKFCIAAAYYKPNALFYGVELRKTLAEQAEFIKNDLGLKNITFIKGSFNELDFKQYNHFYFYNSFYENIIKEGRIDDKLPFSKKIFDDYSAQLFQQLEKMPAGTRLVTYHVTKTEIPLSFKVTRESTDGFLKFCIKI